MRSLLLAAVATVAAGTSAKAEVTAQAWLRNHPDSQMDQLDELKDENPDAYALVKTLLMKRSLGLLDPKHPTASFSKAPPQDSDDHAVGVAVYSKFATTEKEKAALQAAPYAEVATSPQGHDWLSWKPKDSAVDDDSMVKNVLGQVADLTGGKSQAAPAPTYTQSSLDADEANILAADDTPAQKSKPQPTAAPVPTQPPAQNFLSKAPEVAEAPKSSGENSYLKGLDLNMDSAASAPPAPEVAAVAETPVKPMKVAAKSALDNFSFDDGSAPAATTTDAPRAEQKAAGKSSALGSWLGLVKPHVQPAAQKVEDAPAVTPAAQAENPYLADLS